MATASVLIASAQQEPGFTDAHSGVRTETCAREEPRTDIVAMMAGEQLGITHEPRSARRTSARGPTR